MNVNNIFFALVFTLLACGQKPNNFYQGVVLDKNDRPIENVKVFEEFGTENMIRTDTRGYFLLDSSNDRLTRLVFVKEGYKTDTIPTVWSQHGERVGYQFIMNDTTIVRLRTEKSY
ncbi:carboxypeptidase-like regulatory domain-containing protein [Maribacter sp. CXY002]|uniref:carboxypeptidase-like regulatory domain-containing protein n=1 Tax=Maribacter luteocoastalis TaxID=3407671 RepID=UPI003B67AD38